MKKRDVRSRPSWHLACTLAVFAYMGACHHDEPGEMGHDGSAGSGSPPDGDTWSPLDASALPSADAVGTAIEVTSDRFCGVGCDLAGDDARVSSEVAAMPDVAMDRPAEIDAPAELGDASSRLDVGVLPQRVDAPASEVRGFRWDAWSVQRDLSTRSNCDPVHPQNPIPPFAACPAWAICKPSPNGVAECSRADGTEVAQIGESCPPGTACSPGSSCDGSCWQYCYGDADCQHGTCIFPFPEYVGDVPVGKCIPCETNLVGCNRACADTNTDTRNCGRCGNTCGAGESCCAGACVLQAVAGCGCGKDKVDTDGDGIADCEDVCPANPGVGRPGKVAFTINFTTAAQAMPQYLDGVRDCLTFAGQQWASKFPVPHDVSIEVLVDFGSLNPGQIAGGGPGTMVQAEMRDGLQILQSGVVHEFLTGVDPNGSEPDIGVTFNSGELPSLLFLPLSNMATATVPSNQTDTRGVCMHELGHALGFSSYRHSPDATLSNNRATYLDLLSECTAPEVDAGARQPLSHCLFKGENAVRIHGGPVAQSNGSWSHLGNKVNPGIDLWSDLMAPVTMVGYQPSISALDVAMLKDFGVPVSGSAAIERICAAARASGSAAPHALMHRGDEGVVLGPKPPLSDLRLARD